MKYLWMLGCGIMLSACGEEAITYQPKEVQQGFFRQEPCNLAGVDTPPQMDLCLCEADISGLIVSQPQVNEALQAIESKNICQGGKADTPAEDTRYNLVKAEAKVTRDDARYFAVIYEFHAMNAGAAHGRSWMEPVIYDKKTGKLLTQAEVVPDTVRKKVNALILQQLVLKNKGDDYQGMIEVDKHILDTFVNEEGCELCTMYPVEGGWEFAFHEYSIGPYAIGIVKVQVADEDIGR